MTIDELLDELDRIKRRLGGNATVCTHSALGDIESRDTGIHFDEAFEAEEDVDLESGEIFVRIL